MGGTDRVVGRAAAVGVEFMMEMAAYSAVNTTLDAPDVIRPGGEQTPTTPKPAPSDPLVVPDDATIEEPPTSTPTRHSFGGVAGQLPLPNEPFTPPQNQELSSDAQQSLKRDGSTRSSVSQTADGGQDVEMGEGEEDDVGDDDGSDNESVTSDSQRPSKKKKGQRFFCTDFPPCQLSFTRSEHLARHIRYVAQVESAKYKLIIV